MIACSCACDLSNRKVSPKNVFGASTGFEPMASALALQCSTTWAMKTHTLGAGQFIEFIVKGVKHTNIMWTADIRMKSRCDHRSCDCDLSNRKVSDSYNIHMIQKYITEKRNDFFTVKRILQCPVHSLSKLRKLMTDCFLSLLQQSRWQLPMYCAWS